MSTFSICIRSHSPSDPIKLWFGLEGYDGPGIYKALKAEGVEPYEAYITDCTGFLDYKPKSIDEACDLYDDYHRLDDPEQWALFLKWYQNTSIKVLKTVRNFEMTLRDLCWKPGDYLADLAIDKGDIAANFDGWDFMDWDAYAKSLKDEGRMAFIADPLTRKIGVFETN